MPQYIKGVATKPEDPNHPNGKRSDSFKMSPDLHTCTMAHAWPHTHNIVFLCKRKINKIKTDIKEIKGLLSFKKITCWAHKPCTREAMII